MPQRSIPGLVLYLLYTYNTRQVENNTIATFADNTAIMTVGDNNIIIIIRKFVDEVLPLRDT